MGTRTITFSLNSSSIQRAINEIERYKADLQSACQELVERLTNEGTAIAKMQVVSLGAFDTGELESSIMGYYSSNLHAGFIKTNCWHALFVEFGTGVYYNGAAGSSLHPLGAELGYTIGSYGKGQGASPQGWVYHSDRDGKFHWTKGMPYRPFMYNTFKELESKAESVAREVFSKL